MMTVLFANTATGDVESTDVAAIKTLVESVATLADSGNFEALEQLYADEVYVDYSSLTGDQPQLKSPQRLMTEWAGVLPGFERIYHAITNIKVKMTNTGAVATADVIADHFVAGLHWQVSGDYRYEFTRTGGQWHITAAQFNLRDEKGTREVFEHAIKNAQAQLSSYSIRQQTAHTVAAFLSALREKNISALMSLWDQDAIIDMPNADDPHQKRVMGRDNVVAFYQRKFQGSPQSGRDPQVVLYPMQDPETLFLELRSNTTANTDNGTAYDNLLYTSALIHVVNEKIMLVRYY